MNIGPGNIEALLLEALEGRLSAADAELVWAALEAHPEWGVSWDFEDSELPRLQAEDVPAIDWTGLKKEVVTDQQIRQALRQDRERHTLDVHAKQSLYRAVGERSRTGEERRLWRYWAAAASVALLVWLAWPTSDRSDVPAIAGNVTVSTDTSSTIAPTPIAPIQPMAADHPSTALGNHPSTALENHPSTALGNHPSAALGNRPSAALEDRIIIERYNGKPEQTQDEVLPKTLPLSEEEWNIAQGNDTTSLEAPLELLFDLPPTQNIAVVEEAPRLRSGTEARTYSPLAWLKMKAGQIAARKEADGTLPTVRRDEDSFSLQWGSLSINAH